MRDLTHILIVDDDEEVCKLLSDALSDAGFEVMANCCPPEAIELARRQPFDLVILDINMPDMDGFALAKELRGIRSSLGIIFVTGYASFENALEAIKLGVSDFIEKPFKIADFLISVNRVAESLRLERKVQEKTEQLRHSEELYRSLVENIADGVALFSEGKLVFQNKAFGRLLGLESMTLRRKTLADLLHPEDRLRAIQDVSKLLKGTLEAPVRYRFRKSDGTYCWISVNSSVVYLNGNTSVISSFRDITSAVEMETVRKDMDNMLRHDMRSHLVAIVGLSNRLLDKTSLTEVQQEYCRQIENSGRQLEDMVETYLDVARLERGVYKPKKELFNFLDVVAQTRRTLRDMADRKNVDIVIIFNKALYALEHRLDFVGDRIYIQNAMDNLVKNAIEASPENMSIKIKMKHDDEHLLVQVHNWGAVPEQIQSCFFEKYVTSGKKNGMGLGTYMAHLVVTKHGGSISCNSAKDEGTTVSINLPRECA
jgi:PAS domain S-box-containing protein